MPAKNVATEPDAKKLKTDNLKEAFDETKEHLKSEVNTKTGTIKTKGEDIFQEAKCKAMEWKEEVAERWLNDATDYVKAHPIKCVLSAFGLGYVIGRLFRR
ncbi:MAG: hypothetical protein KBA26_14460 [Candidatus Delongbacteria bacterium]|nr:hypothetical protein [Candidatus Delongbacteria bacterium]